ncbi:hypothetical protein [Streptomyces malaysiensis]|uniref:hypothetical protein n=1 Tax=Streptomyces malaysiensis TaxID=92644 RepID=UPI00115D17D7|nr:hypothetical protein [Streptomyces malaysiensis]
MPAAELGGDGVGEGCGLTVTRRGPVELGAAAGRARHRGGTEAGVRRDGGGDGGRQRGGVGRVDGLDGGAERQRVEQGERIGARRGRGLVHGVLHGGGPGRCLALGDGALRPLRQTADVAFDCRYRGGLLLGGPGRAVRARAGGGAASGAVEGRSARLAAAGRRSRAVSRVRARRGLPARLVARVALRLSARRGRGRGRGGHGVHS